MIKSCCKTLFKLRLGHGFNRAEPASSRQRLQPLRAHEAPQGLKPSPSRSSTRTTEVVP